MHTIVLTFFSNTGSVSFFLYLTFIAIAIASLIILYKFLKSGTLEPDKLDKLVDFFKTVVMTTALATVAYVITDLFKEREQDVKELEYFDKYVQEVKEVNGQGRLQLSKYLSIVAPSGEMKESWTNYYREVKKDYEDYLKAQKETTIDTTMQITVEQQANREANLNTIAQFESPLTMKAIAEEWYIVVGSDINLEQANFELNKARKLYPNCAIMKKGNAYCTVILGFDTKEDAQHDLAKIKSAMRSDAYIVTKTSWCPNLSTTPECLVCQ